MVKRYKFLEQLEAIKTNYKKITILNTSDFYDKNTIEIDKFVYIRYDFLHIKYTIQELDEKFHIFTGTENINNAIFKLIRNTLIKEIISSVASLFENKKIGYGKNPNRDRISFFYLLLETPKIKPEAKEICDQLINLLESIIEQEDFLMLWETRNKCSHLIEDSTSYKDSFKSKQDNIDYNKKLYEKLGKIANTAYNLLIFSKNLINFLIKADRQTQLNNKTIEKEINDLLIFYKNYYK